MSHQVRMIDVNGRQIAWQGREGAGPGVIFLGGFASDMTGTKAEFLDHYCAQRGRAYTRLDYSGHGASSGDFEEGCIGDWAEDAITVLEEVTEGPQVIIGSSMGGWIALLMARARPDKVSAFVGIAAAPDFTEDLMWPDFDEAIQAEIMEKGVYYEPSEYSDEPTPITRKLIEDGRNQLVLRSPLQINAPVRLIQGMQDPDVPWQHALKVADHVDCDDVDILFRKQADHRLSEPADLALLAQVLDALPL